MAEAHTHVWHPWLRIQRLFRAILTGNWNAEVWKQLKPEIPKLLAEQSRIRRAGWFMYKAIREAELEMQRFRRKMARRDRLTPRSIAHDIWEAFDKSELRHFPQDFVPAGVTMEIIQVAPVKKVRMIDDLFEKGVVRANGHPYDLRHADRAAFLARILEQGGSGSIAIPIDPKV